MMGLKKRSMPRDVTTRWNSTYDMLDFAVNHKIPLNAMTSDAVNKLRLYEMNEEEWGYAVELRDVLKVREERVYVVWPWRGFCVIPHASVNRRNN